MSGAMSNPVGALPGNKKDKSGSPNSGSCIRKCTLGYEKRQAMHLIEFLMGYGSTLHFRNIPWKITGNYMLTS